MSFILEALRKSEAERRAAPTTKGAAAGVYVVAQARRKPLMSVLLPLAALAAGIGLAVGWDALSSGDEPSAAQVPAVAAVVPDASGASAEAPRDAAQAESTPESSAVRAAPATPAKITTRAPATPSARNSNVAAGPLPAAAAVVRPAVKTVVAGTAAGPAAGTSKANATGAPAQQVAAMKVTAPLVPRSTSPAAPTVVSAQPAGTAAGAAAQPAAQPATSSPVTQPVAVATPVPASAAPTPAVPIAPAPVPAVVATAPIVADEPPKLTVSGFANAEDTRARFAVIDNRIVREGEMFAPDLRLVQVGDDGVVVEYKGRRYRP